MPCVHLWGRSPNLKTFNSFQPLQSVGFWFAFSILASILYAWPALQEAFSGAYVIQDDARQHVAWMQRFIDSTLFPGDLSADYFQSVAPWFYPGVYRLAALVGLEPLTVSKILPVPLFALTSAFAFGLAQRILPVPWVSCLSVLMLNKLLWLEDDIVSATPVAIAYPLLLASLYFLVRGSLLPFCGAIALLGQTYPQCALIVAGLLVVRLVDWTERGRLASREQLRFSLIGLGVVAIALAPYVLVPSPYGPAVTAAEARTMIAFSPEGWSSFFHPNPWQFWFCGPRSGLLPPEWCKRIEFNSFWSTLPQLALIGALPFLLRSPQRFPLAKQVTAQIWLLPQLLLVSGGLFLISHALVFRLHLPNRYTEHTIRIGMAIAVSLAVAVLMDWLIRILKRRHGSLAFIALAIAGAALVLYPEGVQGYPVRQTNYVQGQFPQLYEFLERQPPDRVVAGLTYEINNLPAFTHRSILVGGQGYALPYHQGYFAEVTRRSEALIQAQYSPSSADLRTFIQDFGVDFWLLEQEAFSPQFVQQDAWLRQYPPLDEKVFEALDLGIRPALMTAQETCKVLEESSLILVDARCILTPP
jgi:hypothetical protein